MAKNKEFKPTKEQEEAVEKAREKISKSNVKRHEKNFETWRLSGSRTH